MTEITEKPVVPGVAWPLDNGHWRVACMVCPFCGGTHYHGRDTQPVDGESWGGDCGENHLPFRDDCVGERDSGAYRGIRCFLDHGGPVYVLAPVTLIDPSAT